MAKPTITTNTNDLEKLIATYEDLNNKLHELQAAKLHCEEVIVKTLSSSNSGFEFCLKINFPLLRSVLKHKLKINPSL